MARPYSMNLRERVVAAVERDGLSRHEAAARFGVAPSSAIKWVQRYRATGSVAPSQIGGHKPRVLRGEHRDWLLERAATRSRRSALAPTASPGMSSRPIRTESPETMPSR